MQLSSSLLLLSTSLSLALGAGIILGKEQEQEAELQGYAANLMSKVNTNDYINRVYHGIDTDYSGALTIEELFNLVTPEDFHRFDKDSSGSISPEEFIQVLFATPKLHPNLTEFKVLDNDLSGSIDQDESGLSKAVFLSYAGPDEKMNFNEFIDAIWSLRGF